jgi:thiol-disulfide isomerase/thioredoxin
MIRFNAIAKKLVVSLVVILVALCLAAYLLIRKHYIQALDSVVFFEDTAVLETLLLEPAGTDTIKPITVVYLWQSNCPCNASVLPHFYTLMDKYADKPVQFFLANMSPLVDPMPLIPRWQQNMIDALRPVVTHTPAVAIWDNQGQLTYYGAHNLGYVCNADTSFIEKILAALFNNIDAVNLNTMGDGCFCTLKK